MTLCVVRLRDRAQQAGAGLFRMVETPRWPGDDLHTRSAFVLARFASESYQPNFFGTFGLDCPKEISGAGRRRQAEFFYGRLAAGIALLEAGVQDVHVGRGAQREPVWPARARGSLSHKDSLVAAAVASGSEIPEIGVDVETVLGSSAFAAVALKVTSQSELQVISDVAGRHDLCLRVLMTAVFAAKESFFKAAFPMVRRHFSFHAVRVVGIHYETRVLWLRLTVDLSAELPTGRLVAVSYLLIEANAVAALTVLYSAAVVE